jgi:hypothetical protein
MPRNIFGLPQYNAKTYDFGFGAEKQKKKRVPLKPAERIYIWERPKKYGRTCSICGERITKLSDLELDHTRAYSKGGATLRLAHKDCNRMKGSKGLRHVQTRMGLKRTTRKVTRKRKAIKKTQAGSLFGEMPTFKPPKFNMPKFNKPKFDFG